MNNECIQLLTEKDDFLSDVYGFPWLKVAKPLNDENIYDIINISEYVGTGAKVDVEISGIPFITCEKLQQKGWYWGNSKVTYNRAPGTYIPSFNDSLINVESLTDSDSSELIECAHEFFVLDRYRNDPRLCPGMVPRLYNKWMFNNINGRCSDVLVAKKNGKILGFLCVIPKDEHIYFELIGVFPKYQAKGIGLSMVIESLRRYGDKIIKVITQFHNIAMQRVLMHAGFAPVASEVIYTIHT